MQSKRLLTGGRIDRQRSIKFKFNNQVLEAYEGDTLASALLANGIDVVGRSFKYHRPRGIIGHGAEEPNGIVQIGRGATTLANMRVTQVELYDGLEANTVNGWPSLNFDLMAINNYFGQLLSAGFYYKTFMFPSKGWDWYEHHIRKAAGLGLSPLLPDPDEYTQHNSHCDILIVGAGPAGLMAALAAGECGARVILADEQNELGGSLLYEKNTIDGISSENWLIDIKNTLNELSNITILSRSTVFGYYDHNFLTILERCSDHLPRSNLTQPRQRLWRVRAKQVILAQGAIERPMVFPNNDRPGVMLASSISCYLNRYAVAAGKKAIIFTNNDSAYKTAFDLIDANISVRAVVDTRKNVNAALKQSIEKEGIDLFEGYVIKDVKGRKRVKNICLDKHRKDNGKRATNKRQWIDCDLLAMSGGWSPCVHLHSHAQGKNRWDNKQHCFIPGDIVQANISAGAGNGAFDLQSCLEEGKQAGLQSVSQCGIAIREVMTPNVEAHSALNIEPFWFTKTDNTLFSMAKQFVDYQNDTTLSDIKQALQEGYQSVEHVKRYTALGFGTDQGKLGNINGMAIIASLLNKPIEEVGTTTFRPAYTPVTFGAIAGMDVGDLFEPVRKTALHDWHQESGAKFENVGQWHRPWYFPNDGEDIHTATQRECLAARNSVAIMDASTLGKIEVKGKDALTFLNYLYTHDVAKLEIGRCQYGIMLGEDGMVMDDGVLARLAADHFYLTTTTGGAAHSYSWMERWLQTEWPELNVFITSVTDCWSTIALVGPKSRAVLQKLDGDIALSNDDFAFMTFKTGRLAGCCVRIFRISFSGELAFEINVGSDSALTLWKSLMDVGEKFTITPYGTETMHILRAEKGYVIVGQDTDGSVTPADLGMNWLLAKNKDFIGKRSLQRSDCQRSDRKQFVGLLSLDGQTVVDEGSQLLSTPTLGAKVKLQGHVTSSYYSPALKQPIALALVEKGRERYGDKLYIPLKEGKVIDVEIVDPVFYDKKNKRQAMT